MQLCPAPLPQPHSGAKRSVCRGLCAGKAWPGPQQVVLGLRIIFVRGVWVRGLPAAGTSAAPLSGAGCASQVGCRRAYGQAGSLGPGGSPEGVPGVGVCLGDPIVKIKKIIN